MSEQRRGGSLYLRADEVDALLTACAQVLAGPLDGYDEDEEGPVVAALFRVVGKLERLA